MTAVLRERLGQPAPLPFHLGAAVLAYQSGLVAAPMMDRPDFPWHPDIVPPEGGPPDVLDTGLEVARRLLKIEAGIRKWQTAPRPVQQPPPRLLWQSGSTRLLDYGDVTTRRGRPVLVIPSLINRSDVLDLHPDRSFLRALAAAGRSPVLLDWGAPGHDEAEFDLDRYVTARLLPATAFLEGVGGAKPVLLGYCMGGSLAAVLAAVLPGYPGLVTIGAPWDFTSPHGAAGAIRAAARTRGVVALEQMITALGHVFGAVPAETFQQLFALIDPLQVARKFRRFADAPETGLETELFVALEDWLAAGVAMAAPAAIDLLVRWQVENRLAEGRWPCLGRAVEARDIRCPALIVTGRRDTIAAPDVATPLARTIPEAQHLQPDLGHVGMVVSRKSATEVVAPVVDFLKSLD